MAVVEAVQARGQLTRGLVVQEPLMGLQLVTELLISVVVPDQRRSAGDVRVVTSSHRHLLRGPRGQ
ncbi:MAG: hypothetical protein FWE61_10270, partial [Micrococcales bacterium]|nr:hypothetical protein [Micrococcales bacterium]